MAHAERPLISARPQYGASRELPSADELAKIQDVRAACSLEIDALACKDDDVVGDLRICRFLRATGGNVAEASEWFSGFLRWRVEGGIDTARREVVGLSPAELLKWWAARANPFLPFCPYAGRNPDGHVIWYMRQGFIDAVSFVERRRIPIEDDLRLIHLVLEWTMWHINDLSQQEGRMVCVVKVNDFRGFGGGGRRLPFLVPAFRDFLFEMVSNDKKHYCEHNALFIVVNVAFVFRAAYATVSQVLTRRQVSKIRMLGNTSDPKVQNVLRDLISEELLLREYGGCLDTAPGAYPVASSQKIDEWLEVRHMLDMERSAARGADMAIDRGVHAFERGCSQDSGSSSVITVPPERLSVDVQVPHNGTVVVVDAPVAAVANDEDVLIPMCNKEQRTTYDEQNLIAQNAAFPSKAQTSLRCGGCSGCSLS